MIKKLFTITNVCFKNNPIKTFFIKRQFPLYNKDISKYHFIKGADKTITDESDIITISLGQFGTWVICGNDSRISEVLTHLRYSPITGILSFLGYNGKFIPISVTPITEIEKDTLIKELEQREADKENANKEATIKRELDKIERLLSNEIVIKSKNYEFETLIKRTVNNFKETLRESDKGLFIASTRRVTAYVAITYSRGQYHYAISYWSIDKEPSKINYIDESVALELMRDYVNECIRKLNKLTNDDSMLLNRIAELLRN